MSRKKTSARISRRNFAAALAGGSAVAPVLAQTASQRTAAPPPATTGPQTSTVAPAGPPNPNTAAPRRFGPPLEVPPFDAPITFARNDVAPKTQPSALPHVMLLPSVYSQTAEWNRAAM